ncbi:hypothetical protein BDZ89DRAFT_1046231 [Hymenopellis radicata]|nr:hypothetical protein BDZ89DRAFT_1046231 [Hymenopellis radicata]
MCTARRSGGPTLLGAHVSCVLREMRTHLKRVMRAVPTPPAPGSAHPPANPLEFPNNSRHVLRSQSSEELWRASHEEATNKGLGRRCGETKRAHSADIDCVGSGAAKMTLQLRDARRSMQFPAEYERLNADPPIVGWSRVPGLFAIRNLWPRLRAIREDSDSERFSESRPESIEIRPMRDRCLYWSTTSSLLSNAPDLEQLSSSILAARRFIKTKMVPLLPLGFPAFIAVNRHGLPNVFTRGIDLFRLFELVPDLVDPSCILCRSVDA